MNQILYTSNGKPSGTLPVKVVSRFFAISLIVFGTILFGEASYALFQPDDSITQTVDLSVPQINFAKDR